MSKILIVDDEEDLLTLLEARLAGAGHEVLKARGAQEAFERINSNKMDLIILDVMLFDGDGFQLKLQMNQNPATAHIPVIFLTAKGMSVDKVKGLDLGADDYVTKPFDPQELIARIHSILARKDYYESISMRDGLTNLGNIVFFNEQFAFCFNVAKRYGHAFSLVLIDLNDFKEINDKHGHLTGDFILCEFTRILKPVLRGSDVAARCGGDEFALLLPDTDAENASHLVKRIRDEIVAQPHIFPDTGQSIMFSISAGIAAYEKDKFTDKSQVYAVADKMLYDDKQKKLTTVEQLSKTAGKKILIVDDEKEIAFLFGERLQRKGYKIEVAFDALVAFTKVVKFMPDIILLDIRIPAGGGVHVLELIRNNANTFHIPVIVVTANLDDRSREDTTKLGIADFLIKPFDINVLTKRIEEVLQI